MEFEHKARADKLAIIYLNDLESVSNDAGWHQDNLLGLCIDFGGQPPRGTGNDKSNAKQVYEITFLRRPHALLPDARAMIRAIAAHCPMAALALLARHFYAHEYLCRETRRVRTYTNAMRAKEIGQTLRTYERNLARAYAVAEVWLAGAARAA